MKHLMLFEKFNVDEKARTDYSRKDFSKYPFEMHFSDRGMADAVGANTVKELTNVAKKRNLKAFAIYKSTNNGKKFHNTSDEDFLVSWYDDGTAKSFWYNRSENEPELLDKRLKSL